jgi:hypothetical protein
MKQVVVFVCLFLCVNVMAQNGGFPESWKGNWKGELKWYKNGSAEPQKVNMELKIWPADSSNTWTWQIIYGKATEDNRPYQLIRKDTAGVHWAIDERNGIVLDQYWIGQKFCGAFTVMGNTIVNNYWMEKGRFMLEFFSIGAKPLVTTGKGTDDNPSVDSYRVGSYQKAILSKVK